MIKNKLNVINFKDFMILLKKKSYNKNLKSNRNKKQKTINFMSCNS